MSNKQKYLTVLATAIQPKARTPKIAWDETEKNFETNLKIVKELPPEDTAEMLTYAIMGMHFLSMASHVDIFHDVVLDDLRTRLHDMTCPHCKGEKKEDNCGREDAEAPQPQGEIRAFSSFEELIEAMRGGTRGKPS
jgi:hypothetical protein